jgi:hypothetical protein
MAFSFYPSVITGFETNNRYDIKNNVDQMVYIVTEHTDDFTRNAYRNLRPFVLRVTDCLGREIMTMQRPFRCTCCCFCCPSARQEVWERNSNPYFLPHAVNHCEGKKSSCRARSSRVSGQALKLLTAGLLFIHG